MEVIPVLAQGCREGKERLEPQAQDNRYQALE